MNKILKTILISIGFFISSTIFANDYPIKDIRIIVPYGAGGGTDILARSLASRAQELLGTNIYIENHTGGGGAFGMSYGARQRPDGYTLTMITREIISLPQMGLMRNTADDFALIRLINLDPALLLVPADSPFNNIHDLITAAKKKPRTITFASTAAPNFYLMALQKSQKIQLKAIPYNGAAEAISSILTNKAQVTIVTPGESIAQLRSGELKALGIMSAERISYMPDIPTLIEQGIDVKTATWRGIAAPKNTPTKIIETIGNALDQAMASSEFKEFMATGAMRTYPLNSQEFAEFIKEDTKQLAELTK